MLGLDDIIIPIILNALLDGGAQNGEGQGVFSFSLYISIAQHVVWPFLLDRYQE